MIRLLRGNCKQAIVGFDALQPKFATQSDGIEAAALKQPDPNPDKQPRFGAAGNGSGEAIPQNL